MNVFVLSTGRCGSVTFAQACGAIDNYTVGHESRARMLGPARLAFPDRHIEVDNRLSWFLGSLADRFPDDKTLYVHLTRDPELVVDSFARRWSRPYKASMIRAFGHGIVMQPDAWEPSDVRTVCEDYVRTVNDNIRTFLRGRRSMTIDIADAADRFPDLVDRIGAMGDLAGALGVLGEVHNAG